MCQTALEGLNSALTTTLASMCSSGSWGFEKSENNTCSFSFPVPSHISWPLLIHSSLNSLSFAENVGIEMQFLAGFSKNWKLLWFVCMHLNVEDYSREGVEHDGTSCC